MNAAPKQHKLTVAESPDDARIVRKSNDEIGYKVKSGHLSLLSRKIFNVLIWHAQELRKQEDAQGRWSLAVAKLIKDARFRSKDYDLLRSALDELQEVRVVRAARGGGVTSEVLIPSYTLDNVSHAGNEQLARGEKRRGGELRLWFMLPPELKRQLLDPDQYTRLPIAIMATLKTVPGLALYEICRRYVTNPGGITHRDAWQNWWRILVGATPDADPPEYKYAKRDVFKRGVEEINALTDIEVELIEFKTGKFVRDIQFSVHLKQQARLDMGPPPIDAGVLSRIAAFGLSISDAERLTARYAESDLLATITLVEDRIAHPTLTPIESPAAYFRKALRDKYASLKLQMLERKNADKLNRDALKRQQMVGRLTADVDREAARDRARRMFDALDKPTQDGLLAEFEVESSGNAVLVKSLRRFGLNSKLVEAPFMTWLASKP